MAQATALCAAAGVRLTPVRRRVLELIWRSHQPVGAYALLDVLRVEGWNAAPPTVYRALDFLMANGLVHRLETLNAFIGCPHAGQPHPQQYLVCEGCGSVTELADKGLAGQIAGVAAAAGFHPSRQILEIFGRCAACGSA